MVVFVKYLLTSALCGYAYTRHSSNKLLSAILLASALQLGGLALLFRLRKGAAVIGKDSTTGKIPLWSYIIFAPFHLCNALYLAAMLIARRDIPSVSEVLPGLWIGGVRSYDVKAHSEWQGVVDLTNEFPELSHRNEYLNLQVSDGNAPTLAQLDAACEFVAANAKRGPVLVHCAFGVGRSTTVLCAVLVALEYAPNIEAAFRMIKKKRACVRLDRTMRSALERWETKRNDKNDDQ